MIAPFLEHIDSCPTAHHVVERASTIFRQNGIRQASLESAFTASNLSNGFVSSGGTIIAWKNAQSIALHGIRIVGAHTDSPGLHIKPNPDTRTLNWHQLQVEVYGGPLLNSWLDRDLGIAGHVVLRDGSTSLFTSQQPVARVPQLAIHLDREVNDKGLILNRHQHLSPIWATTASSVPFESWLAQQVSVSTSQIASWSAQLVDSQRAQIIGRDSEFIASSRIDNQISCWAAVSALLNADADQPVMIALFDHEEVGSQSSQGAGGPMLEHVLERLSVAAGSSRSDYLASLQKSHCVSADNAHAVHPNYVDRHEMNNAPFVNEGVVVKTNVSQRYATSPRSIVPIVRAASTAGVNLQTFSSRNNIACGSTIGPITATRIGIETVDIGVPQLSMHSIREMCGTKDPIDLIALLNAYFLRS
ncbi:MAG: putative family aminopeptidase 2 [Actinomycetota bacterium]